jgi:hypothetical protein
VESEKFLILFVTELNIFPKRVLSPKEIDQLRKLLDWNVRPKPQLYV